MPPAPSPLVVNLALERLLIGLAKAVVATAQDPQALFERIRLGALDDFPPDPRNMLADQLRQTLEQMLATVEQAARHR